jgi:hypothetical protein
MSSINAATTTPDPNQTLPEISPAALEASSDETALSAELEAARATLAQLTGSESDRHIPTQYDTGYAASPDNGLGLSRPSQNPLGANSMGQLVPSMLDAVTNIGSPNSATQNRGLLQLGFAEGMLMQGANDGPVLGEGMPGLEGAVGPKGPAWFKELESRLESFMQSNGIPENINALVQWVLRESYLESTNDLKFFAEKVKFFNEAKKQIRDELNAARKTLQPVAGQDGKTRLPTEFIALPIVTEYSGIVESQQGSQTGSRLQQLTAESEARQAAEQVEIAELTEQWEALPDVEFEQQQISDSRKFDGTGDYNVLDDLDGPVKAEALLHFRSMSPQEQQALIEHLLETPINIRSEVRESDNADDRYINQSTASSTGLRVTDIGEHRHWGSTYNFSENVRPMLPAETFEQYLDYALGQISAVRVGNIDGKEGKIKVREIKLTITLPGGSARPDAPARLVELDPSLAATSQAVGSTEFTEGEPIQTKAALEDYIKTMEEKLQGVGDDSQLANVDLQNVLQKMQQVLQQMSNISKKINDTALAIIRNTA